MIFNSDPSGLLSSRVSIKDVDCAPFSKAKAPIEKLRFLLRFATLAPSNHNTQPWFFRIHGDEIELRADRSRALPASDPFDRELIISCGASLAFLNATAEAFGCNLRIDRFPDHADTNLLARIAINNQNSVEPDEKVINSILKRRTNRNA